MQICARAPVRFCDLGGWTDTRVVPRGTVLNFAARLYTYVRLTIQEGQSGITLESLDTGERVHFHDVRRIEYDGVLDLLKAAVARAGIVTYSSGIYPMRWAVKVQVRSDAPPASGLGSSAALGVADLLVEVGDIGELALPRQQEQEVEAEIERIGHGVR